MTELTATNARLQADSEAKSSDRSANRKLAADLETASSRSRGCPGKNCDVVRPSGAGPADAAAESETAAKLAMALRSFSLAQREADSLRASNEKLTADKAALEANAHSLGSAPGGERAAEVSHEDRRGRDRRRCATRFPVLSSNSPPVAPRLRRNQPQWKPPSRTRRPSRRPPRRLATALRSYSLVQADLDGLKAANEKLAAEKSSLEQQLAVSKSAVPIASQAQALREQLRQTQAQVAALADENARLKNQLVATPAPRATPARPGVSAPAASPTVTIAAANPPPAGRAAPPAAAPARIPSPRVTP